MTITINQARRRISEALGLFVDDADEAELIDNVVLPRKVQTLVNRARATHKRADKMIAKL